MTLEQQINILAGYYVDLAVPKVVKFGQLLVLLLLFGR